MGGIGDARPAPGRRGVVRTEEFSIVIASLGASTAHGDDLGAVAAAFVLVTAIASPLLAKAVSAPR